MKNPVVVAQRSGLSTILKNVIDCQLSRINEALITTILHLLNHPHTRQYVHSDVELEVLTTHIHSRTQRAAFINRNLMNWIISSLNEIVLLFLFLFQQILAPYTDFHYRHNADTAEGQLKSVCMIVQYICAVYLIMYYAVYFMECCIDCFNHLGDFNHAF